MQTVNVPFSNAALDICPKHQPSELNRKKTGMALATASVKGSNRASERTETKPCLRPTAASRCDAEIPAEQPPKKLS